MRPEKANVVSDLSDKLKRSPFVLVTDYQRMKVGDFSELRNRLAPAGAEGHVVKDNFLKRAMTDSGLPGGAGELGDAPAREVLQAQLLGLLLSPATRLVRLLNEPGSALARLLKAKVEKEGAAAQATASDPRISARNR